LHHEGLRLADSAWSNSAPLLLGIRYSMREMSKRVRSMSRYIWSRESDDSARKELSRHLFDRNVHEGPSFAVACWMCAPRVTQLCARLGLPNLEILDDPHTSQIGFPINTASRMVTRSPKSENTTQAQAIRPDLGRHCIIGEKICYRPCILGKVGMPSDMHTVLTCKSQPRKRNGGANQAAPYRVGGRALSNSASARPGLLLIRSAASRPAVQGPITRCVLQRTASLSYRKRDKHPELLLTRPAVVTSADG
jgi:hypothetical protein